MRTAWCMTIVYIQTLEFGDYPASSYSIGEKQTLHRCDDAATPTATHRGQQARPCMPRNEILVCIAGAVYAGRACAIPLLRHHTA